MSLLNKFHIKSNSTWWRWYMYSVFPKHHVNRQISNQLFIWLTARLHDCLTDWGTDGRKEGLTDWLTGCHVFAGREHNKRARRNSPPVTASRLSLALLKKFVNIFHSACLFSYRRVSIKNKSGDSLGTIVPIVIKSKRSNSIVQVQGQIQLNDTELTPLQ